MIVVRRTHRREDSRLNYYGRTTIAIHELKARTTPRLDGVNVELFKRGNIALKVRPLCWKYCTILSA
jgi:hypothetical protein